MPKFIPGLQLNRMFFREVIRPLMKQHFPKLKYSAGLLGEGSDVLGFDNETSMDHSWGPRGVLFLSEKDFPEYCGKVDQMLKNNLPFEFEGFSTNYTRPQATYLVQRMEPARQRPINHLVKIFTIKSFFREFLAVDPFADLDYKDWLTFPQQALLEVTAGEVFHDGLEELSEMREKFRYYPKDVWLYIMKIQWERMGSELSFPGRTGERGDEVGSAIVTTRMLMRIMTQCFIMEKHYVPYPKWFGTAFQKLIPARKMTPILIKVLRSKNWKEREKHLGEAYKLLGKMHNALGVTEPIPIKLTDFHGRGYQVLGVGRYMDAINRRIRNPDIKKLKHPFGAVDQFISYKRLSDLDGVWRKFKDIIE